MFILFFFFCFFFFFCIFFFLFFFFFSSRRRHTRYIGDWSQTCALPICLRRLSCCRILAFTRNPSLGVAVEKLVTLQTPQKAGGFRDFRAFCGKTARDYACSRSSGSSPTMTKTGLCTSGWVWNQRIIARQGSREPPLPPPSSTTCLHQVPRSSRGSTTIRA